ncbi:hypothetical protein Bbelb_022620 [Branchiostoma belcheri]|nr:hypothetical protein Bbelb_022620 [Branchiostoma belcheri]
MCVLRAVLLLASISGSHGNRCTKTLPTTGHVRYSSRESAQAFVETFIQSSMKPGETLCFTLDDLANDDASSAGVSISMATNGSVPLLWQLTYQGIEMDYGVKNRYSFFRPKYESKCICDCPQYADTCNSKTDLCSEHELEFCYNTYISDQTAHGCDVYWNSEESEVCCALHVGKDPESPKYDAVYLSSDGKPVVKLALKVYDSRTDEVVFSYPAFTVALNDRSHKAQHWVRMEVTGDTPTQIDSGYYYAASEGTQLHTDVSINSLNEFDPRKMGWLKVGEDGTLERPPERVVVNTFHLKTKKCWNNFDYSETWQIYGHGNWEDHSGSRVEDFYDWVRGVRYSRQRRSVTVVPRYDRLITVKIGINTTTNVLFYYHDSDLIDFTAEVRVDRHSNRFANITLVSAVGSLVGSITPYSTGADSVGTVHRFELHVDSPYATDTVKRISLPKTINGTSRMCLSPLSKPGNEVCKTVPFVQEALQDFLVPPTWRPGNPGDAGAGFNFNWLLDFFGFLNPAEWFNGIQGWLELFAMLLDIALFIVVAFLVIKVCGYVSMAGCFTTKVPKWGEGVEMSVVRNQRTEHGLSLHGPSHLGDFTAEVVLDRFSNRYANITLVAAVGSLAGSIASLTAENQPGVPFAFELLADSPSRVTLSKRVPLPSNIHGPSRLCLSPLLRPDQEMCKEVPFVEEAVKGFLVPPGPKLRTGESRQQSSRNGTAPSFLEYLNPSQWLDGVQTPQEGAAVAVGVFLMLLCAGVVAVFGVLCLQKWNIRRGFSRETAATSA